MSTGQMRDVPYQEGITIFFRVFEPSHEVKGKPLAGAHVVCRDSATDIQLGECDRSGSDGIVKLRVYGESMELFRAKLAGELPAAVDLFFSCSTSDVSNSSRPASFSNRQGLYCEGRCPKDLILKCDIDHAEARYLEAVFKEPDQREKADFADSRNECLRKLFDSQHRIVVVVGEAGSGKSSVLRQSLFGGYVARRGSEMIYCVSFELDNSARAFIESFDIWMQVNCGINTCRPISYESLRRSLQNAPAITFVIDEADEISDTGRDRGYGEMAKRVFREILSGESSLCHHGIVYTSRFYPKTRIDECAGRIIHVTLSHKLIVKR